MRTSDVLICSDTATVWSRLRSFVAMPMIHRIGSEHQQLGSREDTTEGPTKGTVCVKAFWQDRWIGELGWERRLDRPTTHSQDRRHPYRAQKAAAASARKSGIAVRRRSWGQSHQAMRRRSATTLSGKRSRSTRAGLPTATANGGKSLVTIEPAPTAAPVPTVMPGSTTAPWPIHTSWPRTTGLDRRHWKKSGSSGPRS